MLFISGNLNGNEACDRLYYCRSAKITIIFIVSCMQLQTLDGDEQTIGSIHLGKGLVMLIFSQLF